MGQHPIQPVDERVERGRRTGAQSLCARPDRLRLVERLGRGGRRQPGGRGAGHGDQRVGGVSGIDQRRRRDEADGRAGQRARIVPISHSQDTAGPMARSVRDAALLFGDGRPVAQARAARTMPLGCRPEALRASASRCCGPTMSPDLSALFDRAVASAERGGGGAGRGEDAATRPGRCAAERAADRIEGRPERLSGDTPASVMRGRWPM